MPTMRQRGVLGALFAAAILGVAAVAVMLPATVAAASVTPAPASSVSVSIAGEARVGALLTASVDFENGVAPGDAAAVEFEWLLEKPAVLILPTPTPAETVAAHAPALVTVVSTPPSLPLLSCVPSSKSTTDAAALPPTGTATATPAPTVPLAALPQDVSLAALPALPLVAATQLPPEQAHVSAETTPTIAPTPASTPAATPAPTPTPPTAIPRGPEYTVLPADLGHTIRVRAVVSVDGQLVASCESAPTALVVAADAPRPGEVTEPLTPLQPAVPAEAPAPQAEAAPTQWQPSYSEGSNEAGGEVDEVLAQPAPAASGPVVSINLSSEVMLIGGAAVLVVVAGLAIFGRNES